MAIDGTSFYVADARRAIKDFGSCLYFDGTTSDSVSLGTDNPFADKFYISSRIKWDGPTGGYQTLFAKRDAYSTNEMMFDIAINNTTSQVIIDSTIGFRTINYVFPVGEHVDFTWVHNTGTLKDEFWSNAQKVAEVNFITIGSGTAANLYIGGCQSPLIDGFNGKIDEIAIGTVAPTWDEEIAMVSKYEYPSLWTYLKCDEGSGLLAADSSGNGNDGVLTSDIYTIDKVMGASRETAVGRVPVATRPAL